jgi:hypothetical protein
MRTRVSTAFLGLALLSACSTQGGPYPSLAPRAAENIDPRVPVVSPIRSGPVSAGLAAHLAALVDQAQSGDAAFRDAAANAERLTASAGAPSSESWVVAQQALSAAQAARGPTTRAMGDIDGLGSTALATKGRISQADMYAIQRAAAIVSEIDQREAERIDALQKRLRS